MSLMHEIDRIRFDLRRQRNMELAEAAEAEMIRQRRENGLPLYPKGPTPRRAIVHLPQVQASRLSSEKPSGSDPKRPS